MKYKYLKPQELSDNQQFTIIFGGDMLPQNSIMSYGKTTKLQVLENPYRKWYQLIVQFLTFNYYKAPYQYKVKVIKDEK